jgi:hypothetical protein
MFLISGGSLIMGTFLNKINEKVHVKTNQK